MKMRTLLTLLILGLMVACSPATKLERSWADTSFTPATTKPFTKVLIVAPLKDQASQRIAEDKIAAQLKQGVAVQSYSFLLPTDTDPKLVEVKLKKNGFDGVIVMRLKDVENSTSYVPGTSFGGWYGYRNYSPGYYTQNKTFMVETNFFSLESNKLLWSGTTSSLNPISFEKTIDEIIATIKFELQKKGFLKK